MSRKDVWNAVHAWEHMDGDERREFLKRINETESVTENAIIHRADTAIIPAPKPDRAESVRQDYQNLKPEEQRDFLRSIIHTAIAPMHTSMTLSYEDGLVDGSNTMVHFIAHNLEPLSSIWAEIESTGATIRTRVLDADAINKLESIKPQLELLSNHLGTCLAEADTKNRAVAAKLNAEQYIDFSYHYQLRTAALDYANISGEAQKNALLVMVRSDDPLARRIAEMTNALKPTRTREKIAPRKDIGERVQTKVDSGKAPQEAIDAVHLELCTGQRPTYRYSRSTIKSYYYQWLKETGGVVVS